MGNLVSINSLLVFVLVCSVSPKKIYHRLNGLKKRDLSSPGSGGWNSRIEVLAVWGPSEVSLLELQMAPAFWLCLHMSFSLCVCIFGLSSSSYDTGHN